MQHQSQAMLDPKSNRSVDARSAQTEKEIAALRTHYEQELQLARKEKGDYVSKQQELLQNFERLKQESMRQVQYFRGKYMEYKEKMRKANQNIGVLGARVAKFDMEVAAEKDERPAAGVEGVTVPTGSIWHGAEQLQELLANDCLNEEIRKLLAEPNF